MVKVGDVWDNIVTAVDTVCHYCAEQLSRASPATLLKILLSIKVCPKADRCQPSHNT